MRKDKEKEVILGNLVIALKMLEKSSSFVQIIPEVRTNLVYALPEAKSEEDVAGIEGRITVVDGMPKACGLPQFGASSHMARFIIEIMKVNPKIRAGINLIYNEEFGKWIKNWCKKNNLTLGYVDRSKEPENKRKMEGDSMSWKVSQIINSTGGRIPDIAYEKGAVGKEDISVIIGTSATEVAEKAIKIGDEYVKSRKN